MVVAVQPQLERVENHRVLDQWVLESSVASPQFGLDLSQSEVTLLYIRMLVGIHCEHMSHHVYIVFDFPYRQWPLMDKLRFCYTLNREQFFMKSLNWIQIHYGYAHPHANRGEAGGSSDILNANLLPCSSSISPYCTFVLPIRLTTWSARPSTSVTVACWALECIGNLKRSQCHISAQLPEPPIWW